jgi:purine-binding chemotaxis protein CheW
MRHVVFRVAAERYALPLEAVREVVLPQPPFARVPRVSEAVQGVMNLRGRVLAVVDLAALVGLPVQPLREGGGQVLILDQGKRALGLLIGGVQGVEEVEPPAGDAKDLVCGVVATAAGAVTLLSPEPLFRAALALFGER